MSISDRNNIIHQKTYEIKKLTGNTNINRTEKSDKNLPVDTDSPSNIDVRNEKTSGAGTSSTIRYIMQGQTVTPVLVESHQSSLVPQDMCAPGNAPSCNDKYAGLKYKLASMGIPYNILEQISEDDPDALQKLQELEALALDNDSANSLYEKCFGMDAVWSHEQLELMGFNSDYYINLYFEKLSNGGYCLKRTTDDGKTGLWVEDEFLSDANALREKLGITSLNEYFNIGENADWYLSVYEYSDPNTHKERTKEEKAAACEQFKTELAAKLGKDISSLTDSDILFELHVQYLKMGQGGGILSKGIAPMWYDYYDYNINNSRMQIDNPWMVLSFGNMSDNITLEKGPLAYFKDVIYNLEDNTQTDNYNNFNNTLWQALCKAANIKDSDDIESRARKMENFLKYDCGLCDIVNVHESYIAKIGWDKVFNYLMCNGFIEQNTYSEAELKNLYTDDEIAQQFYIVKDVYGNASNPPEYRYKASDRYDTPSVSHDADSGKPVNGITVEQANICGYNIVHTAEELQTVLNSNPAAVIVLENDIDMSSIENWIPVGTEDCPFTGTIYANGHSIKNLKVNSTNQYAGLFGVFAGEVYDLTLKDCKVIDSRTGNEAGVGGTGILAGKLLGKVNNVTIDNCELRGRDNAGLICGIIDSYGACIQSCTTSGYVYSEHTAGGIVGYFDGISDDISSQYGSYAPNQSLSSINDCTCSAEVNGQVWAGGIAGQVQNVYLFWSDDRFQGLKISSCVYEGSSINKDIKNPPGALGAGGIFGQMDIPDDKLCAYDNKYEYHLQELLGNNRVSGNVNYGNTYAYGNIFGWLCSVNSDGSVNQTKTVPASVLKYKEKAVGLHNGNADSYSGKPSVTGAYSYVVLNGIVGEQEQFLTDPTYIDAVKLVILQNFVNWANSGDIFDEDTIKLDQLTTDDFSEEFLTRANWDKIIDEVIAWADISEEDIANSDLKTLIKNTIQKLVKETIHNLVDELKCTEVLSGDWVVSLIAAMGGDITSATSTYNQKDEMYVNSSTPPSITFTLGDTKYTISLKGQDTVINRVTYTWKEPEYITYKELHQKLKSTGLSEDEIENVISNFYNEAIVKENNNGKEVLLYYFDASYANKIHYWLGALIEDTQDLVDLFSGTGNMTEYERYWNKLALNNDFIAKLNEVESVKYDENGSVTTIIHKYPAAECLKYSSDGYDIVPGIFTYNRYLKDENGNYIIAKEYEDGSIQYKYVKSLLVWDSQNNEFIDTQININSILDSQGKIDYDKLNEVCDGNTYLYNLIKAYFSHTLPTNVNVSQQSALQAPTINNLSVTPIEDDISEPTKTESFVYDTFSSKTPYTEDTEPETYEPEVIMTFKTYKTKSEEMAASLNLSYDDKTGRYYKLINGEKYYYLWNPYKNSENGGFEVYTDSYLNNELYDERKKLIIMITAALSQGLNLTSNPKICRDDDGNYYDFDEYNKIFVMRNKINN